MSVKDTTIPSYAAFTGMFHTVYKKGLHKQSHFLLLTIKVVMCNTVKREICDYRNVRYVKISVVYVTNSLILSNLL